MKMHRFILGVPPGMKTDHRNGNGLDNQRSNIREATVLQNNQNRRRTWARKARGRFKGVFWDRGKWVAKISFHGRKINLGRFVSEEDAALAYDAAAKQLFGEFAAPNFD